MKAKSPADPNLSTPPFKYPHVLSMPPCEVLNNEISEILLDQYKNRKKCLIINLRTSNKITTEADNQFISSFKMPISFPDIEACVHVSNDPQTTKELLSESEFKNIEQKHKSILIVGDEKSLNPKFVAKHPSFDMANTDNNLIMSMCVCKNKIIYGSDLSPLSVNLCQYGSECHLNANHNSDEILKKYRMINIACPV